MSSKINIIDLVGVVERSSTHLVIPPIQYDPISLGSARYLVNGLRSKEKSAWILEGEWDLEIPLHWDDDYELREDHLDRLGEYDLIWLWGINNVIEEHAIDWKDDRSKLSGYTEKLKKGIIKRDMAQKSCLRHVMNNSKAVIQVFNKSKTSPKMKIYHDKGIHELPFELEDVGVSISIKKKGWQERHRVSEKLRSELDNKVPHKQITSYNYYIPPETGGMCEFAYMMSRELNMKGSKQDLHYGLTSEFERNAVARNDHLLQQFLESLK